MPDTLRFNPYIPPKFAFLLTSVMVFTAYVCDDGLFLVPAFAPLAFGLISGTGCWHCSKAMFVSLLALSALLGVTTARFGGNSLGLNMLVVYIVVSAFLSMSGAKLFPAYSVALLPVFLGEQRLSYVGVVLALALLAVSFSWNRFPENPLRGQYAGSQRSMVRFLLQGVLAFPLVFSASVLNNPSFLLPALWYVFVSFFNDEGADTQFQVTQLLLAVLLGAVADFSATSLVGTVGLPGGAFFQALVYAVVALLALLLFYVVARQAVFLPALCFVVFPFLRDGETSYVLTADLSVLYIVVAKSMYCQFVGKNGLFK